MTSLTSRPAVVATVVGMILTCGCGQKLAPPALVYPVSGKVTYKGKPLVGADVTFFNAEANRSAFGRTNDEGEYSLTTFSANDGAVAGDSAVTISKTEAAPSAEVAPVESTAYVPPGVNQSTDPPKPKSKPTFPEKYGKRETSGLVAAVKPDAPNEIDFDLKD